MSSSASAGAPQCVDDRFGRGRQITDVVVDEAHDLVAELAVLQHPVGHHPPEVAGARDQDALETNTCAPATFQEFAHHLRRRSLPGPGRDEVIQRLGMPHADASVDEAAVVCQFRLAHRFAQAAEPLRAERHQGHVAVAAGVDAKRRESIMKIARSQRIARIAHHVKVLFGHQGRHAIEHGDRHLLP